MRARRRIAVVVPAYQEAALVERTLRAVPAWVDRIVLVDDGSTDGTAEIARSLALPRVRVVRHPRNLGVGAALATGYRVALLEEGHDVAVVMAGDAQMDPADLPALLEPLLEGRADYVKGDRLSHPEAERAMPPSRHLGNRVLSWLTRRLLGCSVRDSQCGYTAISREAAARLPLEKLWPRYGYPNDLLGLLLERGLRVADVVVRPVYADERSGVGLRHALFVVPWVLLRAGLRMRLRRWRQAPLLPPSTASEVRLPPER